MKTSNKLLHMGNKKYVNMTLIAEPGRIPMVQAFFAIINPEEQIRDIEQWILGGLLLDEVYGT